MTGLGGYALNNHILVGFAFGGLDGIGGEKDAGVTVTRIAGGVLGCLELNVVRRRHLPTGHCVGIREDDAIPFEQIGVRWYVAHNDIIVWSLRRLVRIPTDAKIEPRWIEGAERYAFGILTDVTIRAILVGDRVTDLARQFILVDDVLLVVWIFHRIFVTRFTCHGRLVPHRGAHLPIAMHRGSLVTRHTRHFEFAFVHIARNEIIVAKEFIAYTRAMTGGTRLFDRRVLAGTMSCQESAARERRATDVALPTRRMAFGAMVVERFAQDGRVYIGANGFKISPIAILIDVQVGLVMLDLGSMAKAARFFRLRARFGNQTLMRGGFIGCSTVALVTKDTAEFAMCGLHKLGIAQKDFFPRFQRGHGAPSAFPLRFCRFFDFVNG